MATVQVFTNDGGCVVINEAYAHYIERSGALKVTSKDSIRFFNSRIWEEVLVTD